MTRELYIEKETEKEQGIGTEQDLILLRTQLAVYDEVLIDVLIRRYEMIEKIMKYKEKHDMPILQPSHDAKQAKVLAEKLKDSRYQKEITDVYNRVKLNSKRMQARHLFSYNICLIGFMGAGKTTICDYLSTCFAMDVVEMDQIIAQREGMSIPDIFELKGEEYFRQLETDLLIEMQQRKNVLVSCGGGVPLRERNVAEMKKNGKVVLLTATPRTILHRVKDSDERPVLNGNKNEAFIAQLMEKRREKYEAAADIIIDTNDKPVEAVCEEIVKRLLEAEQEENA